jgi:branched-subunit amino acid permease
MKPGSCVLAFVVMVVYLLVAIWFSNSISEWLGWCLFPLFLVVVGLLEAKRHPRDAKSG